jgi:mRNA interferase RelE/StbE
MQKNISVTYTNYAIKDLDKLDKNLSNRITQKINVYTKSDPLLYAKSLGGIFSGLYRYRIGNYRAILNTKKTS